jgi:hypothetical protein
MHALSRRAPLAAPPFQRANSWRPIRSTFSARIVAPEESLRPTEDEHGQDPLPSFLAFQVPEVDVDGFEVLGVHH